MDKKKLDFLTSFYFLKRFSLRQLFLTTLAIFLLGTIVDAIAPNFTILLLGRLIQAIAVGIIMPLFQNLMVLLFPPNKRSFAMGMSSVVIILDLAIGPTLSGWIVEHYNWRMLFQFLIPLTIIILIFSIIYTKNVTEQSAVDLDWWSVGESSIGLGLLLYGFSRIGTVANIDLISAIGLLVGIIFLIILVDYRMKLATLATFTLKNKTSAEIK
ncbi:multidrug efflux MFS transporter [Lactobacillus reuteri]|uniref:MFS transporter n=1 Tax=Limosilactobacillus reuteri TaxID=1598 RepID=UPI00146DA891|nr:MFS transporter [Limosilactobacillus reuteri]NMV54839.1 multidrug efflux MFS transporter [Limosilactobacillus reuteri]NMV58001.1 multidrug efflux MFS transporter [Limosilactobacillus reuteri]